MDGRGASDNRTTNDFIYLMKDRSSPEMSICSEASSKEREYLPSVSMGEVEQTHTKRLGGLFTHEGTKIFQSKLPSRKRKQHQDTTLSELHVKKRKERRSIKMYETSTIQDESGGTIISVDLQDKEAPSELENQQCKTINSLQLQNETCQIAEFSKERDNQTATNFIYLMKDRNFPEMTTCSEASSEEREYLLSVSMGQVEQIHTKRLGGLSAHEETKIFQSKLPSRKRKQCQSTTLSELCVKKRKERSPIKIYETSKIQDESGGTIISVDFQDKEALSELENKKCEIINSSQLQNEAYQIEEFTQAPKACPESFSILLQRLEECLTNLEGKNLQTSSLLLLLELHLMHFENKLNKLDVSPSSEILSSVLCNEHCKRCNFIRCNISEDKTTRSSPIQNIYQKVSLSPQPGAKSCFKATLSDVGDCQAKQCSQTRQTCLKSQNRESRIAYLLETIKECITNMQFKHSQPSSLYQLIEHHYMLFDYELNAKISSFSTVLANKQRGTEESETNQISGSPRTADINFGTSASSSESQNKNSAQYEFLMQERQTIKTSEFPDEKHCTLENPLTQSKINVTPSFLHYANQYLDILISFMNYELQKTVAKGEKLVERKRKPSKSWKINPSGKLKMKIFSITSSSESSDETSISENEEIAPPFTPRTLDAAKEFITPLGLKNSQLKKVISLKSPAKNILLKCEEDQCVKDQITQLPELEIEQCQNFASVKVKNEIQETSFSDVSIINEIAEPKNSLSNMQGYMINHFPKSRQSLPNIFTLNQFNDAVQNTFQSFTPFTSRTLGAAKQFITPLGVQNSQVKNDMSLKLSAKNMEAFHLKCQEEQSENYQTIQSPELAIEQCQNSASMKVKNEIEENSISNMSIISQSSEPKAPFSNMQGYRQNPFPNSREALPTTFSPNQFDDPVQNTFQSSNYGLQPLHINSNFESQYIMASENPHVFPCATLVNPTNSAFHQSALPEDSGENISVICEPIYSANFETYNQFPESIQTNVTFANNNFVENLRNFHTPVQKKQNNNFTSPVLLNNNCVRINMQFEPMVQTFYIGDSPGGTPYNGTVTNNSVRNNILFQPRFQNLYRDGSPSCVPHNDTIANTENILQNSIVLESDQQANSDEINNDARGAGSEVYLDVASTLYGAACITIEKCARKNPRISSFISSRNLNAVSPIFTSGTGVSRKSTPAVPRQSCCHESSCPCTELRTHKEIKIKVETDNMDPMTKYTISLFENQDCAQFFRSVLKYEYPVQHRRLLRRLWEDAQVLNYYKITGRHISPEMKQQILKNNPHPVTIQKPQN